MARAGESIEHPVTGEQITWLTVAADSDGALLRAELRVRPHGFAAAMHIHPGQEERFQVTSGTVTFLIDGTESAVAEGQSAVIPRGHPHAWWNGSGDEITVIFELRPALRSEVFFETLFGLARDGKVNAKGLPNLLQMAVALHDLEPQIRLAKPPFVVQRMLFTPLAWVGRMLGYRSCYRRYSSTLLSDWAASGA